MEIVAYGSPKADCKKCRESEALVEEVLEELGATDKVTYVKLTLQDTRAAEHGVMVTPSLVIDDQIVADGKLPDRNKLKAFLAKRLGS
jgi:predicted thioredoxin/glutaredoxin